MSFWRSSICVWGGSTNRYIVSPVSLHNRGFTSRLALTPAIASRVPTYDSRVSSNQSRMTSIWSFAISAGA